MCGLNLKVVVYFENVEHFQLLAAITTLLIIGHKYLKENQFNMIVIK